MPFFRNLFLRIGSAVEDMSDRIEQIAAASEEIAASAQELAGNAESLHRLMSQFKLEA